MTYSVLPAETSPFWGDAVANVAALPVAGSAVGETVLTLDTGTIYYWDGAAWGVVSAANSGASAADTDSVDMTVAAGVISGAVRLSADAADAGSSLVAVDIRSGASPGLRSQISNASIRALLSAGAGLSYDNTTGVFTLSLSATDTDSVDMTVAAGAVSGALRISPVAADGGSSLVNLDVQTGGGAGLRAQILNSVIRALFSAGAGLSYDNATGIFSLSAGIADITAVIDGSAATAGDIGEIISASVGALTATGVGATGDWGSVTSVALTAGIWELAGVCLLSEAGATLTNSLSLGISTSATGAGIAAFDYVTYPFQLSGSDAQLTTPTVLVSTAGAATLYLNTKFNYTAGTPQHAGKLTARRIR